MINDAMPDGRPEYEGDNRSCVILTIVFGVYLHVYIHMLLCIVIYAQLKSCVFMKELSTHSLSLLPLFLAPHRSSKNGYCTGVEEVKDKVQTP